MQYTYILLEKTRHTTFELLTLSRSQNVPLCLKKQKHIKKRTLGLKSSWYNLVFSWQFVKSKQRSSINLLAEGRVSANSKDKPFCEGLYPPGQISSQCVGVCADDMWTCSNPPTEGSWTFRYVSVLVVRSFRLDEVDDVPPFHHLTSFSLLTSGVSNINFCWLFTARL